MAMYDRVGDLLTSVLVTLFAAEASTQLSWLTAAERGVAVLGGMGVASQRSGAPAAGPTRVVPERD